MSAPAVTKHLKSLERGGLISRSRTAQWRPCKFETAPIDEATHWIEELRAATEARLDRLEDYLASLQSEAPPQPPEAKGQDK